MRSNPAIEVVGEVEEGGSSVVALVVGSWS